MGFSLWKDTMNILNSDTDGYAESFFQRLYLQGHSYNWQPYLSHALVSGYTGICVTLHQSGISARVKMYVYISQGTNQSLVIQGFFWFLKDLFLI